MSNKQYQLYEEIAKTSKESIDTAHNTHLMRQLLVATVESIAEDYSYYTVILAENYRSVKACISPHQNTLNATGWFKVGDIVLVSIQGMSHDCQIINKLASKTKPILGDDNIQNNDKIAIGLNSP